MIDKSGPGKIHEVILVSDMISTPLSHDPDQPDHFSL